MTYPLRRHQQLHIGDTAYRLSPIDFCDSYHIDRLDENHEWTPVGLLGPADDDEDRFEAAFDSGDQVFEPVDNTSSDDATWRSIDAAILAVASAYTENRLHRD